MNATFCRFVLAGLISCSGLGCTTAYDAYGHPQQVVDPTTAVVGAAAVGALAYGLAKSDYHDHDRYRYRGRYYDRHDHGYYRPGGYYRPPYCPPYRAYGYPGRRYY